MVYSLLMVGVMISIPKLSPYILTIHTGLVIIQSIKTLTNKSKGGM